MHENAVTLNGVKRERVGSRYAKRAREAGHLPAVVYGHGEEPMSVALDAKAAIGHIMKGEKVFKLAIEGVGDELVLLRDLQYDYLGTNLVHADFSRVDLQEKVTSNVHVKLKGDAKGLKTAGAVLTHPVTELTVECSIANLPDEIEVDISELGGGGSILAKDVAMPSGVTLAGDPNGVIAHIVSATKQDDAGEGADAASGSGEPEVISGGGADGDK